MNLPFSLPGISPPPPKPPFFPLEKTGAARQAAEERKLRKAAQELEGVFLSMLIKEMQASVPQDDLFNNETTQIFTELLGDEFGKLIARGQSIGLANAILQAVKRSHGPGR